jgi:hypothetical protein
VSYYVRLTLYTDTGIPCGYVQAPANDPHFSPEYMEANPTLFQNVQGNWYHRDPTAGDTTHPALLAD